MLEGDVGADRGFLFPDGRDLSFINVGRKEATERERLKYWRERG